MTIDEATEIISNVNLYPWFYTESEIEKIQAAYKCINATLEKEKWIPVTERLPEKHDCYLVTTKWKGSYSGDIYTETNMAVYREKLEEWDSVGVIAWMPLPEPYEGGAIANEN